MRIHEFATPDEQLQLWRLVSDAVWSAIDSQRQQQPTPISSVTKPQVQKSVPLKAATATKVKKVKAPPKPKSKLPSSMPMPLGKKATAQSKLPTVPMTPNQRWAQRQQKLGPMPMTKTMGTKIPQNQPNVGVNGEKTV
jgi:hypothetical protein